MGYCISQVDSSFAIPASNIPAAIEALKGLANKTELMGGGSWRTGGERTYHFSWCDMTYVGDTDFVTIMRKLRWDVEIDAEGNVSSLSFAGEKLGDEEHILGAIAPFVEDGSFIEMKGEDGARWKWSFKNGQMVEKTAKIVYEDEE